MDVELSKWLSINANRSPEVYERYREELKKVDHHHTCPEHGRYRCPWSICSIQRGTESTDFNCHKCIIRRRGMDPVEVGRLRKLKTKQIKNKRQYRGELSRRPTNKTARG